MANSAIHRQLKVRRVLCVFALAILASGTVSCRAPGPLHHAAANGDTNFVKSWIAEKRDLDVTYDEPSRGLEGNYSRRRGVTALIVAARAGHFEVVKLLADGGANLYAESPLRDGSDPRNAFDYAVEAGKVQIAQYLWDRSDGVRFATRLDEHIAKSCARSCREESGGDARSNLALFLISITKDPVVLGKGIDQAVCFSPQPLQLLTFLETHGVRFPGNTLHCVAYNSSFRSLRPIEERIAVASFLLDRGADLNNLPHAPLRGAAAGHDIEMVKFFLARGADPNLRNAHGETAVGAAANICIYGGDIVSLEASQKPQLAVIEQLVNAGADTRLPLTDGGSSRLRVLTDCCNRKPQTKIQRRICEIFGL